METRSDLKALHGLLHTITLLDFFANCSRDIDGLRVAAEILRNNTTLTDTLDTLEQPLCGSFFAQPRQHFGRGPECRDGVGDALPRDVEC